jgi:hypothetical protein
VLHRVGERRAAVAERALQPASRGADGVQVRGRGHAWRGSDGRFQGKRGFLGLVDPGRVLGHAERDELRAQLAQVAAARGLLCQLAQREDRDGLANAGAIRQRLAGRVESEPRTSVVACVRAEVDPLAGLGLGRQHADDGLAGLRMNRRELRGAFQFLRELHEGKDRSAYDCAMATDFSIGFAAAIVVLAASFAAGAMGRLSGRAASAVAALLGSAAVAAWIAFALEPELSLGVAAAGLSVCTLAEVGAYALARLVRRGRTLDADYARAEQRLADLIDTESRKRAAELERTLARARADSASNLAEEERRIAEERRRTIVERERSARDELAAALATAQQQVERRFGEWARDLDRIQDRIAQQVARVGEQQRELIAKVEARIQADADRIAAESEEQRAAIARLREELGRSIQEMGQAASAELDAQAADRRRALHEVADRLRRREQVLAEQIAREETDASARITQGFADVERRQLEQLERVVERATSGYADQAAQQFSDAIKVAREEAARRLARELERAVAAFEREASGVLSERLANISDTGAARLEKRMSGIAAGLERQRDEALAVIERGLVELESEIRRRVELLAAEVDAERTVAEARLHELARRIDEVYARTS